MRLSVLRLLPWMVIAAAPAAAVAGPTGSMGISLTGDASERLDISWRAPVVNSIAAHAGSVSANPSWLPERAGAWSFVAPADLAHSFIDAWLLDVLSPVSIMDGMDRLDAAGWMARSPGAGQQRKPLEGEDREIELFPSLITFFCNPYRLDAGSGSGESGICFRSDTRPEIDLGVMGRLGEDVRVALFSTLSTLAFTDELLSGDRKAVESEAMTHRFALLLSVSPAKDLFLGAAGGAEVVDSPRSYVFELLFEARLQF